ncbi:MAG: hypothetical protein Q7R41_14975 [Phycisphaerales bacterium]|nr:hypothetical protein [Phycisphaerales bacterium]
MRKQYGFVNLGLLFSISVAHPIHAGSPMGTAFTNQGRLKHGGVPYTVSADLRFLAFTPISCNQAGAAVEVTVPPEYFVRLVNKGFTD